MTRKQASWQITVERLRPSNKRLPPCRYGSQQPTISFDPFTYRAYIRQPQARPELPTRTELRHMLMGYKCDRWEIWQVMKHYKVTWAELTQVIPESDLEKYSR